MNSPEKFPARSAMSHQKPLKTLLPTEPFELESGLSLIPRVRLNLTIHRADKSVALIDEWKLKRSLIDYLKKSHSISVPEEEIKVLKYRDLKKRKREDPVARGSLFVLDFEFLSKKLRYSGEDEMERDFMEWRKGIAAEMDGMELNLEGLKFKLSVEVPKGDDFEGMRKEWEEMTAFGSRGMLILSSFFLFACLFYLSFQHKCVRIVSDLVSTISTIINWIC